MKNLSLLCLLSTLAISATNFSAPPETEISNGIIKARLYLPDANNGYYRGSRFDWSGVMSSLEYKNHQYFGQWFKEYSPTLHDAIQGPVEAFDPIGYEEAKPGESFLKIGIGMVTKPDTTPYHFAKPYPVVDAGDWKVTPGNDQVKFIHTLTNEHYSYDYEKTVKLTKGKPELVITHTLKNTGSRLLETSVFNHNFFVMDNQPTGPGFTVTFPIAVVASAATATATDAGNGMNAIIKSQGSQLSYLKEQTSKDRVLLLDMTAGKTAEYKFNIENHTTGAAVKITADQPISKLVYWSAAKTLCPEPFIKIEVEPGSEFSWTIRYEFYEVGTQK